MSLGVNILPINASILGQFINFSKGRPPHQPKKIVIQNFVRSVGLHCHQFDCIALEGNHQKLCFHLTLSKTSQELRMLSTVTHDCQVTKIVMNSGNQLSEL